VELVVAQVERRVDGLEGFKIKVDLFLLALVGQDGATVNNETIGRSAVVELKSLLGRRDGSQD
jgi:hypothetical protein